MLHFETDILINKKKCSFFLIFYFFLLFNRGEQRRIRVSIARNQGRTEMKLGTSSIEQSWLRLQITIHIEIGWCVWAEEKWCWKRGIVNVIKRRRSMKRRWMLRNCWCCCSALVDLIRASGHILVRAVYRAWWPRRSRACTVDECTRRERRRCRVHSSWLLHW